MAQTDLWGRGRASWSSYIGSSFTEGPDGKLYACHSEDTLTTYSPSGQRLWEYTHRDRTTASSGRSRLIQAPALDDHGNVYLSSGASSAYPEGYLIKLNPRGEEVWCVTVDRPLESPPVYGPDGRLYVVTSGGDLLSLDTDGRLASCTKVGDTGWNTSSFGPDGQLFLNTAKVVLSFQPDLAKMRDFEAPDSLRPSGPYGGSTAWNSETTT